MTCNLVDPSYELLDPCPDIYALFMDYNHRFFQGALGRCEVRWSPRMFTCAGVCSYECRSGMCSIRLSKPLLILRPRKDLVETLLHEMIHAYLFITRNNRDREGHGPEFQAHMYRINRIASTHITIYHSFHDEVSVYKQHWWRCDGKCQNQRPFFGYVKRTSNRAPSPNDRWWNDHQSSCGGAFIKIKEPDGYTRKRRKTDKKSGEVSMPEKKECSNTLERYFKKLGKGYAVGSSLTNDTKKPQFPVRGGKLASISSGELSDFHGFEKRLDGNSQENTQSTNISTQPNSQPDVIILMDSPVISKPPLKSVTGHNTEVEVIDIDLKNSVTCPSCNESVLEYYINEHLDHCIG